MINVAILGFGVVGSGVAEVIERNAARIEDNVADEVRVKYIVDVRDFPDSAYGGLFVKDFSVVEEDPDVSVVVESIGGVTVALDFTKRSMRRGKSVVTSNKELVATHGYELINLAREMNVSYLFEASVGGGIPIVRPITQCLAANELREVFGILNGTTNYILTRMIKEGLTREDALEQAQRRGYAESSPADDLEGRDACRKICILASLCFGRHVYPDTVSTEGIGGITLEDAGLAGRIGYKIKLLGRAFLSPDGKTGVYVAPHLISSDRLLSGVDGVMNAIVVRGNAIGDVLFYGAGAGKLPTASAIVADIIDAAKHKNAGKHIRWEDGSPGDMYDVEALESPWYVRVGAGRDSVARAFGEVNFISAPGESDTAFATGEMSGYAVSKAAEGLSVRSRIRIMN
jgi:homoserine dehydrogenase